MQTLPPNWRSAKDADGKEYFFNELTGETSWKFPDVGGQPVSAAVSESVTSPSQIVASDSSEFAPASDLQPPQPAMAQPNFLGGGVAKRAGPGGYGGVSDVLGEGVLPRVLIIIFCSCVTLVSSAIEVNRVDELNALIGNTTLTEVDETLGVTGPLNGAAEAFGVAVGSISLGLCIMVLLLAKYRPVKYMQWTLPKVRGEWTVSQLFSLFLAVWWCAAAAVLTFFSPFTQTSNAYFAIWAAFVMSVLLASCMFSRVAQAFGRAHSLREDANVKAIAGLALASAVVLFSCIEFVGLGVGLASFGLISGITSTVLATLLYFLVDRKQASTGLKKGLAAFFVLLWFINSIVLTFPFTAPFRGTGNGYFGTWFATFCAFSFAYQEFVGGDMPLTQTIRHSFSFKPMDDAAAPHNAMGASQSFGSSSQMASEIVAAGSVA